MAIQTPFHSEGFRLPHQRHSIHPTVTGFAAHAFVDVNAVIEVNEVRNLVDPRPLDRTVVAEARPHRLQCWTVGPNLLMAVHAHLRRRNTGKGGLLNRRMAVTAVNAKSRHVMFVAEWHRLITNHVLIGDVRRADDASPRQRHSNYNCKAAEDREARESICRPMKNLRHYMTTVWQRVTSSEPPQITGVIWGQTEIRV